MTPTVPPCLAAAGSQSQAGFVTTFLCILMLFLCLLNSAWSFPVGMRTTSKAISISPFCIGFKSDSKSQLFSSTDKEVLLSLTQYQKKAPKKSESSKERIF